MNNADCDRAAKPTLAGRDPKLHEFTGGPMSVAIGSDRSLDGIRRVVEDVVTANKPMGWTGIIPRNGEIHQSSRFATGIARIDHDFDIPDREGMPGDVSETDDLFRVSTATDCVGVVLTTRLYDKRCGFSQVSHLSERNDGDAPCEYECDRKQ